MLTELRAGRFRPSHSTDRPNTLPTGQDILRDILHREGIVTRHRRGECIVRVGARSDRVYLIEHGFVAETRICRSGKRQVLDFEMDGSILTPLAADMEASGHAIEVLADTTSHMMSASSFRRMAEDVAGGCAAVTDILEAKLSRAQMHLTNMGCNQGHERIRHLLLMLVERMSKANYSASFVIPIRQVDLADAAGVTTVYVNQILKRFEAEGALSLQKGAVVVKNPALLECPA